MSREGFVQHVARALSNVHHGVEQEPCAVCVDTAAKMADPLVEGFADWLRNNPNYDGSIDLAAQWEAEMGQKRATNTYGVAAVLRVEASDRSEAEREVDVEKPTICTWCLAETTDLKPFRVSYRYRKGVTAVPPDIWWLSPCCLKDVGDSGKWVLEAVEDYG